MPQQPHRPAGTPAGGQFAETGGAESASTLSPSATPWPPVDTEAVQWQLPAQLQGHVDIFAVTRLERTPYMAAIPATIADLDPEVSLSQAVRSQVADAVTSIALFDAEAKALPVAMPAMLLRTESASSSQIEHLTANARNVALASLGSPSGQNATEVAANTRAMTEAITGTGGLDTDTILRIHRSLMRVTDPDIAGRFRDGPVWIGRPDISPHGADFIPPRHDRVEECLGDLERFTARPDVNTLVKAAIAHAQFETIHPFADGNGRTGRAIVHTILRSTGLATHSTVPISAGLLSDVDGYFRALGAYRDGNHEPIISAFAGAATRAIANGRHLASDITGIRDTWHSHITARSDSSAWALADHLFTQPVVSSPYVERELELSKQGAFNAIATLERAGVLKRSAAGRRNQVWQANDVLAAMDAFAERAGRRTL